jgi:hypothetical protein
MIIYFKVRDYLQTLLVALLYRTNNKRISTYKTKKNMGLGDTCHPWVIIMPSLG